MPLCFVLLFPPRAPDGPLPAKQWRRLLLPLATLLAMMLAMMLIGQPDA